MKKKLIVAVAKLFVLLSIARILRWRGCEKRAIAAFSATLKQLVGIELLAESIHIYLRGKVTMKQLCISYKDILGSAGISSIQCSVFSLLKRKIRFRAVAENVVVGNISLGKEKNHFTYLECDLYGAFSKDCFFIHSNSTLTCNYLTCNLALEYKFKERALQLKVAGDHITAVNLLRSFPDLSCRDLYAMSYAGDLSFEISGGYCADNMAKNYFNAIVDPANLVINNKSNTVFNQLNSCFVHAVYQNGNLVRSINVGNDPGFMEFNKIPEHLYKIILHTEDPNFFSHTGVDPLYLGYALLQNIQQRKIVRGGGTVTMQLARNLYLNHKRSIYRKMEEMLIAWLLEVVFQVPKKRILEVYLNVIEFAPGIYGIKEACRYYFGKSPAELSITECIVLSYIIPRPKHFDEALNCLSEQLRVNLKKHLDTVSKNLFACGTITNEQLAGIDFGFRVRDKLLYPVDTGGQPLMDQKAR